MNKRYQITEVDDFVKWNSFVEKSPQGTIFSKSDYLFNAGADFLCLWVSKGSIVKAGVCIILSEDKKRCILNDLVIYNGILFRNNKEQKHVKARSERFYITEEVIIYLDQHFNNIEIALSPFFEDLRPFLWHNYHSINHYDKFEVDLRYTSYLSISEFNKCQNEEQTFLFKNLDTIRQRNIREARKKQAFTKISGDMKDVNLFLSFYKDLIISQDTQVSSKKLNSMEKLITYLVKTKQAVMSITRNCQKEPIYIVINCFDSKRAYYLFGAGNANSQERFKGTLSFWDSFKLLANNYNISEIDLEGVNSPSRGWFKLSFGGDLKPYYQLYKKQ